MFLDEFYFGSKRALFSECQSVCEEEWCLKN